MPLSEAVELTLRMAELLEKLGIPYVLGGSMACGIHGEPRPTQDSDFLIRLSADRVRPLVQALTGDFYVEESAVREALSRKGSFNVIELKTMRKIDLFQEGGNPLDAAQMRRAVTAAFEEAPDRKLRITSAEDIVLRKLDWYRRGRMVSDRQWRDVLGVLKVSGPRLDLKYLAETASPLGLDELLNRALTESGLHR